MSYVDFLDRKTQLGQGTGFDPVWMPDFLFDFQKSLVEWAIRIGRGALFEDCGLGKTPQQLVWCENVHRKTNRPVLITTPLAVSAQTIEEGAKFGIEVRKTNDGTVHSGINVTNYENLHKYNPRDFAGLDCDESSAIKSFDGVRRKEVTEFARKMEYRLLATATAAPNDYIELGTSSEALGQLGHMDMLQRFFRNDMNNGSTKKAWRTQGGRADKWRFKGHAEMDFWRWVCSWARAVRKPSDLGFSDDRFVLPTLTETEHLVQAKTVREGYLIDLPAEGLFEERQEQKRTVAERCDRMASIVNAASDQSLVWCHLNEEGRTLRKMIPDSVEVSGSDSVESKEAAFLGFAHGEIKTLISKPKIGAWGLNFQNCARVGYFPSHSFEAYYQAVRRCWRFGQKRPVSVEIVTTDGGHQVMANLKRKAAQAESMFSSLVAQMNHAIGISRLTNFDRKMEAPSWL